MIKNVLILGLCGLTSILYAQYSYELHPIDDLDNLGLVHHPQILQMLDFKGRVYTVRIDETRFSRRGNRWVEGRRNVRFTALFDEKGRLREESQYSPSSDLIRRSGFVPNQETGVETYQVARSRVQNLWSSLPRFNAQGQIVSEAITLESGETEERVHTWQNGVLQQSRLPAITEVYRYDNWGSLASVEIIRQGEPTTVRRVTRDSLGRAQTLEWLVDGQIVAQSTLTWKDDALVSQEISRDGKQYFVEYSLPDAVGNWQKKVIFEVSTNGERTPIYARYRRIHYY